MDTMLSQLHSNGDLNLTNYSVHLSVNHGFTMSSIDHHVYLHDVLADAIQFGQLHPVLMQETNDHCYGEP